MSKTTVSEKAVELTEEEINAVAGGNPTPDQHTWPTTQASQGDFSWKSDGPYGTSRFKG
jgi:hypothetical protein